MENSKFIELGISHGNSLYQERKNLERYATISRAVRQAKLEQAKAYNALRENRDEFTKNELEAKVLEEEAEKLTGAAKELKLFEAKEKRESYPVEYKELLRDAIVKYNFYSKFLEQHPEVTFEKFEQDEEIYFECKKLIDHAEKTGRSLVFNDETMKIPAIKQIAEHSKVIAEYSKNFMENVLPMLDSNPDKILLLESE